MIAGAAAKLSPLLPANRCELATNFHFFKFCQFVRRTRRQSFSLVEERQRPVLARTKLRHRQTTAQMTIYQAMVAIDGVKSYLYVRADTMSQAFDCALTRTKARNPQSYVDVLAAQKLREPVDVPDDIREIMARTRWPFAASWRESL
jgi:hypothetical protein